MSDTERLQVGRSVDGLLRDRIARATWMSHRDRQLAQLGMKPSGYAADLPIPDWAYAIAEAVIAELSLNQETRDGYTLENGAGEVIRRKKPQHRYVTEWENDA
jgi:hypothetical protein